MLYLKICMLYEYKYVHVELFDPSFLEARFDPIRSRYLKKNASIRFDPMIKLSNSFDPFQSDSTQNVKNKVRSNPIASYMAKNLDSTQSRSRYLNRIEKLYVNV